jgi:hypothetical protein
MTMSPLRAVMSAVVLVATVVGGASRADALSCAPIEGYSWMTIADGTASFRQSGGSESAFFDVYDSVVVGKVVSLEAATIPDLSTGEVEGVAVTLEVVGALRMSEVAESYVLYQGDSGQMVGYPFAVGSTYMVPLRSEAPGQVNVCEAIVPLTPDAAAEALDLAAEAGIEVALPAPDEVVSSDPQGATTAEDDTAATADSPAIRAAARWIGVGLVVALVSAVVRRRRRRPDGQT